MRAFVALLFLGLMSVAAHAQMIGGGNEGNNSGGMPSPGFKLNQGRDYTPEEQERMKANEEAAKAARAKMPDPKVSSDPWASTRTAETPATKKPKAPAKQ